MKHGILSRLTVLAHESGGEYADLLNTLIDEHRPTGITEQLLIEELGAIVWHKRRVLLAEEAKINEGLKSAVNSPKSVMFSSVPFQCGLSSDGTDLPDLLTITPEETVERRRTLYNISELERITALLPTQTKRTEEQDEFQQFSTVPALAYAANWVANVTDADTMLEPSAGIGGLAVFAKTAGAKLILNELSSRRAAVLQEVFPNAKVFTENAEQINNVLPESILPSVVVMNPPFSASAGRMNGKRDTQIGAQHVEQALARLADGGRLVAIVGDGMAIDRPAFKAWWGKIGAKYNVRAVVPMDGSGYAKYGTTFDNVLIVIDKVAPTDEKIVTNKVNNYTELTGLLEGIRNDRPEPSVPATTDDAIDRVDAESAHFEAIQSEQGINVAGDAGGGTSGLGNGKPTKKPRVGTKGSGDDSASNNGRSAGTDGRTANTEDTGSGDARGGRNNDAATTGGSNTTGITIASEEVKSTTFTDSIYENYQPQRLQVPGALPHPGANALLFKLRVTAILRGNKYRSATRKF